MDFWEFFLDSCIHFVDFSEYHLEFGIVILDVRWWPRRLVEERGYLALVGVTVEVLPDLMREIKCYRIRHFFIWIIIDISHQQYFALFRNRSHQELIQSWVHLLIIQGKFMVLVIITLTQDFICHWSKIICKCVYDFLVLGELETT